MKTLSQSPERSYVAQIAPHSARIALGLVFLVFGLNGFLHFLPQPPMPAAAGPFLGGLAAAGYFFPLLKATEVVAGSMLLANRFVPLALVVLAPIVVNIVAFHVFLAPSPLMVAFLLASTLYLAWVHRGAYRALLSSRSVPAAPVSRRADAVVPE